MADTSKEEKIISLIADLKEPQAEECAMLRQTNDGARP